MTKKRIQPEDESTPELGELSAGASKALENAKELFVEASLLRSQGALSRALFLHQISLEECAKVDILGAWATSTLMGLDVDVGKVSASLSSHRAKNHTNAYMMPAGDEERHARVRGDWQRAIEAFKGHQRKFHLDSNAAKNASLYVNFADGGFAAPKEVITDLMVEDIAERNAAFLELVGPKVRMLARWCIDPGSVKEILSWFAPRAEELRSREPKDLDKAVSALIQEMFERAKVSRYYTVAVGDVPSDAHGSIPDTGPLA